MNGVLLKGGNLGTELHTCMTNIMKMKTKKRDASTRQRIESLSENPHSLYQFVSAALAN